MKAASPHGCLIALVSVLRKEKSNQKLLFKVPTTIPWNTQQGKVCLPFPVYDPGTHGRQDLGLSSLRIHKLHLQAGRHPTPVAPLGLHLVLNGANLK